MDRIQPTYGFIGLIDNPKVGGIFVVGCGVVVSVRRPIHLPAREDVT